MNAPPPVAPPVIPWYVRLYRSALYRRIADHIGKIMSVSGAVITSAILVVEDNAATIDGYARQYLSIRIAHWVSGGLFVLLFFRLWYAGYKNDQLKAQVAELKKGK